MTAKIQEMILKLENFDYRKLLSESTTPSHKSASSFHQRASSKRKSMSSQCSSPLLENLTKSQIEALRSQKTELLIKKKQAKTELQKQTDKINDEIKKHRKELNVLLRTLKSLQTKSDNVDRILKEKQQDQLEAFRFALRPLEDTANSIIQERKSLQRLKAQIQEQVLSEEDLKSSKNSEFLQLESKLKEKLHEKAKIQSLIEDFKSNEEINYKEYCQEAETRKIVKLLKEKKSTIVESIKTLEGKIESSKAKLGSLQVVPGPLDTHSSPPPVLKEIEDIESYLDVLCKDISITPLMQFVQDHIGRTAVPVDSLVTKHQFLVVESKELDLRDEFNKASEKYQKSIRLLSRSIEEQELELLTSEVNSTPDSQLESALSKNKGKLLALRKEAEKHFRMNSSRLQAIERWKQASRKALMINEEEKTMNDFSAISLFKAHLMRNIGKDDHWRTLEKVIDKYVVKLAEKEKVLQDRVTESNLKVKAGTRNEGQVKETKAFINSWTLEKESLQNDLLKTIGLEKLTIKRFENFKIEIDIERRKQLEKVISENSSVNKSTMQQINRTYGQRALTKYKEKEVEEIKLGLEKRKETVKKKIEQLFAELAEVENEVIELENLINSQCKWVVSRAQKNIEGFGEDIESIERKIVLLDEAEAEINEKLSGMMEVKKREIYRSLHKTLQAHGNEGDMKKIKKLQMMKEDKEKVIENLNADKMKNEENYEELIKSIEIEEIKIKIRLSNIIEE